MFDWLIVEPIEEKQEGLIEIPDSAKPRSTLGKVIEVGWGRPDNGHLWAMRVKEGDKILYTKYVGINIEHEDKQLLMLKETDVLAIVEESTC
jgi:chaperonin GroES